MSEKSLEKVTVDLGRLKVLDCVHHKGPQTSGETEKSSGGQWKVAASPPTPAAHCESKGNQLLVQLDSVALAAADPTPVIFSGWHKLALMFVFFLCKSAEFSRSSPLLLVIGFMFQPMRCRSLSLGTGPRGIELDTLHSGTTTRAPSVSQPDNSCCYHLSESTRFPSESSVSTL